MDFQIIVLFLFGFIQMNSGCQIELAPLVQIFQANVDQINTTVIVEIELVNSILNLQHEPNADSLQAFYDWPKTIQQTSKLIDELDEFFNSFLSYIKNQCQNQSSQASGPVMTIPVIQLQPYFEIIPSVKDALHVIAQSFQTIGNFVSKYYLPLYHNDKQLNRYYDVSDVAVTGILNSTQQMIKALGTLAVAFQNAQTESLAAPASNENTISTLVVNVFAQACAKFSNIFNGLAQQFGEMVSTLSVKQLPDDKMQIDVLTILNEVDQLLSQLAPNIQKSLKLFSEAVNGLKLLENPLIGGLANVAGELGVGNLLGGLTNSLGNLLNSDENTSTSDSSSTNANTLSLL